MFINAANGAIRPVVETRGAIPVLCAGAVIAIIAPWGLPLDGVMAHAPMLRVISLLFITIIGIGCAHRCGLYIAPQNNNCTLLPSVIAGAVMAGYLLLVDGFLFRSSLPKDYHAFIVGNSLFLRLLYFTLRSVAEVIVFQLAIGSTLVWLLARIWHDPRGRVIPAACFIGLMFAHLLNVYFNVPIESGSLVYDVLRFFAPGLMWAFLYCRFGLVAVLIAHSSTHVFFQPLISLLT